MIKTNLKELLKKNKLSINKLSYETGLSRPTLTSLLNNDSKGIQFDTLETLLDFFDISISDFFTITDRKITFYFQERVTFDSLEYIEKNTIHNKENGDGMVEVKPSKAFLFDCVIVDSQKETIPFSLAVSPIEKEEKILFLNLAFFRGIKNNDVEDTADINKFLSKLNNQAIIELTQSIVSVWLKYYTKIKQFEVFLNSMLMAEIIVYGYKTRIPVVIDIHKKGSTIDLSFETYKHNSPKVGDDSFSTKLSFVNSVLPSSTDTN